MDRLTSYQAFVTIYETGSISAAADRLEIGKSVASRRLAELERYLGVQLFKRTTRHIEPTADARALYERVVRLLADLEETECQVTEAHASPTGPMRIAAPLSFGLHHLAPVIAGFAKQNPGIEIDIDFNDRRVDLLEDGFDVGIRVGRLADSSLMARQLTPIRFVVVASPDYLRANSEPRSPADLATLRAIAYSNPRSPGQWRLQGPSGDSIDLEMEIAHRANNGDFVADAVAAGLGIAVLPRFIADPRIARGELVEVLPGWAPAPMAAYALYPPTRHLSRRVRALVDFLAEQFRNSNL